jgi:hypothetical protein
MNKSFQKSHQKQKVNIIKVRNKLNSEDIYYSSSEWPSKQIDGIEFIPVKVNLKDPFPKYVRKDSFDTLKEKVSV